MNLPGWFRQIYPWHNRRLAVLSQYGEMAKLKLALADIALRGGLFSAQPTVKDLYQAGVAEGRRQMALELFKIVHADIEQLFGEVPVKPKRPTEQR